MGDTVWTVHGGNASFLRGLNANYFIYYEIIKDAQKNGFHYIDFFGTTGDPKPENPIYGIHLFKKRLGGEYLEYIGEFDLITRPIYYRIFCTLIPFYRKIKRNLLKTKGAVEMKFVSLEEKEFDSFARHHPQASFYQASTWGHLKEENGWQMHLLGVKDGKKKSLLQLFY